MSQREESEEVTLETRRVLFEEDAGEEMMVVLTSKKDQHVTGRNAPCDPH